MTDPAQLFLVVVITVLTVMLIIVGIYLILLIRDLRVTNAKLGRVLDDVEVVSTKITHAGDSLSGFTLGLKTVLSVLSAVKPKDKS
jgi:hypothetical protein